MKFLKTSFLFLSLIFLNGCLQSTAMLGPGVTLVTTGNVAQAGFQYAANSAIKKERAATTRSEAIKSHINPFSFFSFLGLPSSFVFAIRSC